MVDRRHILRTGATALALTVAGCTPDRRAGETSPDQTNARSPSPSATPGSTDDEGSDQTPTSTVTDDSPLDLREANVTAVAVDGADGSYRFDVTLYHDDDGEDGYANWWQVETIDGDQLGRRELLHAHGTQEFTRSKTVAIPEEVTCVVVRGHDQTHGYGGQALLVELASGVTAAHRQGPDSRSFTDADCP